MILKNKKIQILFLVTIFFCITLISLLGLRNKVKILNKELFQIKSQISKEQNLVKILETDFTNLSKFDRISKIAKDKLGLQRTNSYQIKKLSDFNIN
tara:strand:- start:139 stop:429 length:291 start_codon:yes stop_codon:yes gene_type:complete